MKLTSPRIRILASRYGVVLFLILLVFWGWPATTKPLLNGDSLAYLNWPTPLMVEELEVMGARAPVLPWVTKISEILFRASAWPLPIGVLLLLIPGWEVWRSGRMGGLPGWILVLAAGVYIQAFATFHGDGVEIERHMLVATVLYRIGLLLSLLLGATLLLETRLPAHS